MEGKSGGGPLKTVEERFLKESQDDFRGTGRSAACPVSLRVEKVYQYFLFRAQRALFGLVAFSIACDIIPIPGDSPGGGKL